jgi:malate dehydrogenase (oxaloacetate-decarboxylating)(NADP+)
VWKEICSSSEYVVDNFAKETEERRQQYAELLFAKRQRKGMTLYDCSKAVRDRSYFGAMMVETGEADAMISGLTKNYAAAIRPALQVLGMQPNVTKVAGMYIILTKKGPLFLADTTVNPNPTPEEIVSITELTANEVQQFNIVPRIALLSYSNFGSSQGGEPEKMQKARQILKVKYPWLNVDGDIQANFAMNQQLLQENFPFSDLVGEGVNTLIFPNLSAGNMAYKLLQTVAGYEAVGPILLGMAKPLHILQLGSSVREIVNMVTLAVVDAQKK